MGKWPELRPLFARIWEMATKVYLSLCGLIQAILKFSWVPCDKGVRTRDMRPRCIQRGPWET
eukprot:1745522-Prorocentrum_lima.AAC.1